METANQSQPLATVVNENRKALFSFIGVFLSQQNLSRRKSRKNAYFSSQICTFASSKSERSLAIQNNVPQSTPLISKSLPIHLSLNANTLFFNKIVRKQKIPVGHISKIGTFGMYCLISLSLFSFSMASFCHEAYASLSFCISFHVRCVQTLVKGIRRFVWETNLHLSKETMPP